MNMKHKPAANDILRFFILMTASLGALACAFSSTVLTPPPPAPGAQPQPIISPTFTRTPTRPFQIPPTRRPTATSTIQPTINLPTPSPTPVTLPLPNGDMLLEDDFQVKRMKPLYEENVMTLDFLDGALRIRGLKRGVLPVLYQAALPVDILAEVDIKAASLAVGTYHGFVLRSTTSMIELPQYYLAVYNFNARKIGLYGWQDGKWVSSKVENMPPSISLKQGDYNRVRLEAIGGNFRFFINQGYAGSIRDDMLREGGYFGLYLASDTSLPVGVQEEVYFRNLKLYKPVQ
jgi:hypothetical protein